MNEKMIKHNANFIQNVLFQINEHQKLIMPPSLEDIQNAYSAGVLTTLLAIKSLMIGQNVNGIIQEVLSENDLKNLIIELKLTNSFEEIQNK